MGKEYIGAHTIDEDGELNLVRRVYFIDLHEGFGTPLSPATNLRDVEDVRCEIAVAHHMNDGSIRTRKWYGRPGWNFRYWNFR